MAQNSADHHSQLAFKNLYTHAPSLHANLLVASLQLLAWILLRPVAWRNIVEQIDPTLRPDYALTELTRSHLNNPLQQRLLIISYGIIPLLMGVPLSIILWLISGSSRTVFFGVAFGLAGGTTLALLASGVGGLAFGVAGGFVLAIGDPMLFALQPTLPSNIMAGIAVRIAMGVAIGVTGSVIRGIARPDFPKPFLLRVNGAFIGILISLITFGLTLLIVSPFSFSRGRSIPPLVIVGGLASFIAITVTTRLRTGSWRWAIAVTSPLSLLVALALLYVDGSGNNALPNRNTILSGLANGIVIGAISATLFSISYVIAERIAGAWIGSIAGVVGSCSFLWGLYLLNEITRNVMMLSLIGMAVGLTFIWWLYPLELLWNTLLYRLDEVRSTGKFTLLRWQSAFWDQTQRLPMTSLEEHLTLVAQRNPIEAQAALAFLATTPQAWAARSVQIELDARRLECCHDVMQIAHSYNEIAAGELAGPASALLRSFSRISQNTEAALNQQSNYNQRLSLSTVEDQLDRLIRELMSSSEQYALRFHPIATKWREVVADAIRQLEEMVESSQEIESPYVIGIPLTDQQEIFVGRTDISARIEQLLLDRHHAPLLLYGQRRMGKTSLLNNLGRLLPTTIVPLYVDLQGPPTLANNYSGFLYNMARGMVESAKRRRGLALPPLTQEDLLGDPFTQFDEWLDAVEFFLGESTALLMLDEFEALDRALSIDRYQPEDVLGMLRHIIEHRQRFKLLLAGSHTLDEYQHWSSYLINTQSIPLSYLKESEARQLIEHPVNNFSLRYEAAATDRVLTLTRGHPFLVQLLCAEIVALNNEQDSNMRRLATLAEVEAVVPNALVSGAFFFADIERNQVTDRGRELLRYLAIQGEGAVLADATLSSLYPADWAATVRRLLQRELIERDNGNGYRFQVELIRRWFAQTTYR